MIEIEKSMTPFCILEILKSETDKTRHLTQAEIVRLLESRYGIAVERKAVARHLSKIQYFFECLEHGGNKTLKIESGGVSFMNIPGDEERIRAVVKVSKKAMKLWALQYAEHVEITSPEDLGNDIKAALEKASAKYK